MGPPCWLPAAGRPRRTFAQLWHARMEANKADSSYKLSVSAETNVAAHEIGKAIRAIRREAGELIDADMAISAISRGAGAETLALAVGDKVRLFDRVHDAEITGRAKYSPTTATWWKFASSATGECGFATPPATKA